MLLAGAGLSAAAGVPAAWDVQRDLLLRVAQAQGDKPEDPFAWWRDRAGQDAEYDSLLAAVGRTSLERMNLLRSYFEPTEDERDQGIKVPSAAHRAVAQLMRDGLIRIALTLNFDLLLETALRDLGVEPTIVSTTADVEGMEPLHAQRCLVWHLHGDYTQPEMLNTPDELDTYSPVVGQRLHEVFDQYGLIVVGWSAMWDPALREALAGCSSRRYPTTWVDLAALSETARRLAVSRDATIVQANADDWLARVAQACESLADSQAPHPLTILATVAAAKRDLESGRRPIATHDAFKAHLEQLRALPARDRTRLDDPALGDHATRAVAIEDAAKLPAALVGVLAYWGTLETDGWWIPEIGRFGRRLRASGLIDRIDIIQSPAVILLYAGGVAAVAGSHWQRVAHLLCNATAEDLQFGDLPAAACLGPRALYPHDHWPARRLHRYLAEPISANLCLGAEAYLDAWERWTFLVETFVRDRDLQGQTIGGDELPYLQVDGYSDNMSVPAHTALVREPRVVTALLAYGLFEKDPARWHAAATKAAQRYAQWAQQLTSRRSGFLPSDRRYPWDPE